MFFLLVHVCVWLHSRHHRVMRAQRRKPAAATQQWSECCHVYGAPVAAAALCLVASVIVCISRYHLGVHSWRQIIWGAMFGVLFGIVYTHIRRKGMYSTDDPSGAAAATTGAPADVTKKPTKAN